MSDNYPEDFVDYMAEDDRGLAPCRFHGMQESPCPECFGIDHSKYLSSQEAADAVGFTPQYFTTIARRLGMEGRRTISTHGGFQYLWTKNDVILWKRGRRRLLKETAARSMNGRKCTGKYEKKIGHPHADARGGGSVMEDGMTRWENRIVDKKATEEDIAEMHRTYDGECAQDL